MIFNRELLRRILKFNTAVLFLTSMFGYSQTKQAIKKFTVSGKVLQVPSYCGGANPGPEAIAAFEKPQAYPNKVFYIRGGKINTIKQKVVLSFKTDTAGKFSFELEPGIYSIIQDAQLEKMAVTRYQKQQYIQADTACLKNWWKKPYHILEIKDKSVDLQFSFHHPCFNSYDIPCLQYVGPMPP